MRKIEELKKEIEELKAKQPQIQPMPYPVIPYDPHPWYWRPWEPSITWCSGTDTNYAVTPDPQHTIC